MAYATVTLTGTYQTPDQTPHKGHVEIIPSERVIKDTTGDIILTGRVKVDLDAQGVFTVELPATDDPTLNPTGFGYTIAAKLHSSHPPAVSFSLPAALGATTVEDLTPVDPSTFAPTTTYAESSTVTALDSRVTTVESDKANSADLATVATTGNYGDLTSLPSIPATPADLGAEPAGLAQTTNDTLHATYNRETQAAAHDHAYRTWDALVGDPASTPGLHIFGHSVVAGSGATDQPHTFSRLLKSRIEAARTGAKVTKYGMPGASTAAMVTAGTDGEFASHTAGSVGCLVLMAMLNDYSAGIDPATTRTNLEQIIATYRAHTAAAPNMTVVLVAEWLRQTASGGYPWTDYVAAAQAVADADEYVTLVNLYDRMGQAQGDTLGLYSDGTHPTNKGHALVADLLYADIMRVVPARPVAPATFLPCIVPPVASTSWRSYSNGVTGSTAYGNYVRSSDGPQGASITYQFVGDAGFYTIGLAHRQGPDRGKYDLYIDGVLQGAGGTWEGYAASVADVVQEVANFSVPRSGLHTIKLAMNTKHASSSGYVGAISALTCTRTGPLTT